DQYDGLDGGSAIVDLNGLVDDDGASPVTTLWEVDNPNVTITSPTSLVTTATVALTGSYTITLTATDGTGSLSDTMVANVYDDACAAAIADPAQTLAGDISGPSGASDCVVNMYDFAAMAINWLECASAKLGCTP
ncbi:MAG: PKD domain-containing protein, partial [Planctomycetota bacterium]